MMTPWAQARTWFVSRRRLLRWYRDTARRYHRAVVHRDDAMAALARLERQLRDAQHAGELVAADLAEQRRQHTHDLVLLAQRTRALVDIDQMCVRARDAGVTAINLDKVQAAVMTAGG